MDTYTMLSQTARKNHTPMIPPKTIIYLICSLLVTVIAFSSLSCGIESTVFMDDLNHPVIINSQCNWEDPTVLCIEFICYNFEQNFTGYNVFISTLDTETELRNIIGTHINSDGSINTEVRDDYLLPRTMETDEYPTINFNDVWSSRNSDESGNNIVSLPSASIKTIEEDLAAFHDPLGYYDPQYEGHEIADPESAQSMPSDSLGFVWRPLRVIYTFSRDVQGNNIAGNTAYTIGVTAFNSTNHVESQPSVVQGVTSTNP